LNAGEATLPDGVSAIPNTGRTGVVTAFDRATSRPEGVS